MGNKEVKRKDEIRNRERGELEGVERARFGEKKVQGFQRQR